jgi:hypothetical protein
VPAIALFDALTAALTLDRMAQITASPNPKPNGKPALGQMSKAAGIRGL